MAQAKIECKIPFREKPNRGAKEGHYVNIKEINRLNLYKHSVVR